MYFFLFLHGYKKWVVQAKKIMCFGIKEYVSIHVFIII